jgi:hypothetical protein
MQISVTSAHGGINIAMWAGAVRTTPVPSTATARKSRRSLSGGSSAWPSRPPLRTISLSRRLHAHYFLTSAGVASVNLSQNSHSHMQGTASSREVGHGEIAAPRSVKLSHKQSALGQTVRMNGNVWKSQPVIPGVSLISPRRDGMIETYGDLSQSCPWYH